MAWPHVAGAQHNNTPGHLTSSLDVYCTSHGASYGRENFPPCRGQRLGPGYNASLRPAEYSPSLEHVDNPTLGLPLLDRFTAQNKRHYRPFVGSDGAGFFVNLRDNNKPRESGYLQLTTGPQKLSMCLETEYGRCYAAHQPGGNVPQGHVIAGHRGQTGFTKGEDLELNTFQPKTAYMGQRRQTGTSMMRADYMPIRFLQGTEIMRRLPGSGSRETGFTRETKAHPADRSAPHLPLSQGRRNKEPTSSSIGKKEASGFVLNEPINRTILQRPLGRSHFMTHYWSKFGDPTRSSTREGDRPRRSNTYGWTLRAQRPQSDGAGPPVTWER